MTRTKHWRWMAPWLMALVGLAVSDAGAQNDFDPTGRRRPPPGSGRRPPKPPKPKKPTTDKLIERYTAVLLATPHAAFPLQKLTQLYRQRDGNLDKLVADFETRAKTAGPDQFNARLALAGIYTHAQRSAEAITILDEAIKQNPKAAAPRLMRARLAENKNDKAEARKHYEAALPLVPKGPEREGITRTLMNLCLDLKDFAAAEKFHKLLVVGARGSLYVKKEYGIELMARGHYARAETELRKIVTAAAGDNRALAPALRDLGKCLAKQNKMDEALKVLKRARTLAGSQGGIRNEILALLTDVYRDKGKLVELIAILEAEKGRDAGRLATIGSLYEETGQVDKALSTYREVLKLKPKDIDVRIKLVHLLQTAGQLDEAIKEYEALIKAAPHNADFVFELAETLIQRGERKKALDLVAALEKRTQSEGDILAAIADFYERIEEQERAIQVLERLAKLPQGDPQYLIDLGDRYFQQEKKDKALAAWKKILTVVQDRARALSILGEVYVEHDMPDEALKSLREAVKLKPGNKRYEKQLASALERTAGNYHGSHHRYREALALWEKLSGSSADDPMLARECRTHIVGIWAILRLLESQVAPLGARLARTPPDLEAGRLLAEVHRRLKKLKESEKALRQVIKHAPGDEQSMLSLEAVLVMQRDLDGAIKVLQKLVEANPKRAREYYQRMAQYSSELYRDDDAIKYASRAVELSPDDAQGHFRLAKMYRQRQEADRAMVELRKAISKNDRLFQAHFELAELLLAKGKVDDADKLYRHVVRASRDGEYVMRAARLSMQLNLGRGTLDSLERELLPVALGNPQKPLYRRLLVELYGAMTFPLVQAARLGTTEQRAAARAELAKIGARAVKPLLDALADKSVTQQRIAIEVLAYVQNKGAGPALFNYATGQTEQDLRVRAMVACGALEDADLLPRYKELLAPKETGQGGGVDAVAVAATWGVARMRSKGAEPLLLELVESPSPDIRALAAVGLGLGRNTKNAAALVKLAKAADAGPVARAAAARALGELGDKGQWSLLLALTDSTQLEVQLAALSALARLGAAGSKGAIPGDLSAILARSLLSELAEVRKTAMATATAFALGDYRRDAPLPVPDGAIVASAAIGGLSPRGYRRAEQASALALLAEPLTKAAKDAVSTSPTRARVVAELVMSDLGPLLEPSGKALSDAARAKLKQTTEAIAAGTVAGFVALASHPSEDIRKRAVELLARRPEKAAQAALVSALDERDATVCKTALAALRTLDHPETVAAVVSLLRGAESWSLRVHAARALGHVTGAGSKQAVDAALSKAGVEDKYALVREAAMRALVKRDPAAAKPLLAKVAASDVEPRLRAIAKSLAAPPAAGGADK